MNIRPFIATAGIVAGLSITACAPPPAVHALLQRTACNHTVAPPQLDACTHWINHNAAWLYPPNTEWIGPYSNYQYDRDNNGGERLP